MAASIKIIHGSTRARRLCLIVAETVLAEGAPLVPARAFAGDMVRKGFAELAAMLADTAQRDKI